MIKLRTPSNTILTESLVENHIRRYLAGKGWEFTNLPRTTGAHGADIRGYHPKWRKICIIEVKGEGHSSQNQVMHNAFYSLLGQLLSRMDKEGNSLNKARYYAIGIPKKWEKVFKNKICTMKFGWKLLKPKVFLVDQHGEVEEKAYSYFLK